MVFRRHERKERAGRSKRRVRYWRCLYLDIHRRRQKIDALLARRNPWRDFGKHIMRDLASRLANRIQLTTDGHKMYINAVEDAFGGDIDYAMLIKQYGNDGAPPEASRRYSPSEFVGTEKRRINGNPDMKEVSTSYVERANLTMRMNMRRFTRLTNGFSKKLENHMHAISLFHMHYNFCRIHKSLRVTPAMEAGLTDHVWDLEEVLMMVETARKNVVTDFDSN
jgi:hypothetical protein